jgi:peptidoglycan/LPS O-acetylase OafA/YrhL
MAETVDPNSGRIDFKILDGLRGIAATYVLINHARGNLFIGGMKYAQIKPINLWSIPEKMYFSVLQATSLGREFVIVFFILSGFSIAFSLSRLPRIGDFYLRRMIRIYPPYLVALVWAFVIFMIIKNLALPALPASGYSVFDSFNSTIKNIFYIENGSYIPQFWSLKFEVIFYLLVPFFVMKRNLYFAVSLLIAGVSFFISWNNLSGVSIPGQYILDYNIYFALGVFCFFNYKNLSGKFTINNKYLFYAFAAFLFSLMVVCKYLLRSDENKVTLLIAALFSIVLLFNFLHHNIRNKVLMFLGNISYTIYITHFASIILFAAILLKTGVIVSMDIQNKFLWVAGIPFAIGLSYIFYLIAEKPCKELLNKLRKKS